MFVNLNKLEKLTHHIAPSLPVGRNLAIGLGRVASQRRTKREISVPLYLPSIDADISSLFEAGERRYALNLEAAFHAALEGVSTLEAFIAELPEE